MAYRRGDATPTMGTRNVTVNMRVKWRLIRQSELNLHMGYFYGASSENPFAMCSQIFWNETQVHNRFLGWSRHFNAMLTVALLTVITGIRLFLSYATTVSGVLPPVMPLSPLYLSNV